MSSPRPAIAEKPPEPTDQVSPPPGPAHPEPVPTVPAPPLSDDEWDPTIDPMEGLDPATTWWGG